MTGPRLRTPLLTLGLAALLLGTAAMRGESSVAAGTHAGSPLSRAPVLLGGIDVGETDIRGLARAMHDAELDTLQVSYEARLREWDGAELSYDPPEVLRPRLRQAREAGLALMLVLRVRLDEREPRNRHLWHGLAWPRAAALDAFFARYREFVLGAAEVAQQEGVALLVIGNELNALTGTGVDVPGVLARGLDDAQLEREALALRQCRSAGPVRWHDGGEYPDLASAVAGEQRALRSWAIRVAGEAAGREARLRARRARHDDAWRAILDEARAHFDGLLSYGAGFDSYSEVGFWDATDAIVSTAYFGLRRAGETGDLRAAWAQHLAGLSRVAAARPSRPALPVYLGELGFTRRAHSAVRPWSYEGFETLPRADGGSECVAWAEQPLDPRERTRAFEGLTAALSAGALPQLRGVSLWKLTRADEHAALEPYAIRLETPGEATTERLSEERPTLDALRGLSTMVRELGGPAR